MQSQVAAWLGAPVAWIPQAGSEHPALDARLAALALEHGLTVCSADARLARFTEVRWENPLA